MLMGVGMSRKVRGGGAVEIQSHLEQNLTLLVYLSMQIRAPLVMIYRLPCKSLCLKRKGNILANILTEKWVGRGPPVPSCSYTYEHA